MSVYLNGQMVEDDEVTPGKHAFVGTFRSPHPPQPRGAFVIVCPCGYHLHTAEGTHQHWREGHFDVPVYRTLGGDE